MALPEEKWNPKPCTFCGSASVDEAYWLMGPKGRGPGCNGCGATAETKEVWDGQVVRKELEETRAKLAAVEAEYKEFADGIGSQTLAQDEREMELLEMLREAQEEIVRLRATVRRLRVE